MDAYQWFLRFRPVFGSDMKLIGPSFPIAQDSLMVNTHENFSAFDFDSTEIATYQWFWRLGLVFRSDAKLINPSFCTAQEILNHFTVES